jgi:hypothetical protein
MGFELCQATVGPSTLRGHQSEGMRVDTVRHTEMVGQVAALQVMVSSTMQSAHGHSPTKAFRVDVVDEMITEFREQAKRRSRLDKSGLRICALILGLPSSWV